MILCNKYNNNIGKTEIKEILFENSYDVIVVGLGTAGAIAAICAAEYGLKVLALEKEDRMGGTATTGGVLGYYCGAKGGRFEAIDKIVYTTDNDIFAPANLKYPDHIHPDKKAMVLESEALEAGVDICYDAWTFGVYMEENRVVGLQWKDSKGIHSTESKYVIDCTAEADICSIAGCETLRGRKFDDKTQPFSLCTITLNKGNVSSYYVDNGYINPNDGRMFSDQVLNTYTQKMFLRDHFDIDNYYSVISSQVGIREGRRIVGEESVSLEDFSEGKMTDKPVFYAYSHIDTHGIEHPFEEKTYIEWCIVSRLKMLLFSVPVPKGALIPKGYQGILAAGRCIAVDHDISSCVRMKRDMQKCGEAASALAYISIQEGVDAVDVSYDKLATLLIDTKCLDEDNNIMNYRIADKGAVKTDKPVKWLTDKQEILNQLKSDIPGVGIWSAKRMGSAIINDLRQWLKQDDERLKIYSALALGLLGDSSSIDVLRGVIKSHPEFDMELAQKEVNDGISAIYLLGELGDVESIPYLIEIIKIKASNNQYNQYFLYAMMALVKIGNKVQDTLTKEKVSSALQWILDNKGEFCIYLNTKESIKSDISSQIKQYIQTKCEIKV
jgi:hypothetical protein